MTFNLNGDMSQWTMGPAACPDMYRLHDTSAAVHTIAQSTDVPDLGQARRVIPYSTEITVSTADATVGATDLTVFTYRGEGSEIANLLGGVMRNRIFLKSSLPGLYNLHLSNGAETISRAQPLSVNIADLWTGFDVWFPEVPDPDNSWWTDSRVGYTIGLTLAAGSNYLDEWERWKTGLKFGASQVNFNATVGNKIKIAGLRVGNENALFAEAREITERDCMRYLQKSFDRNTTPASAIGFGTGEHIFQSVQAGAVGQASAPLRFSAPMRKAPTMAGYNPTNSGAQASVQTIGDCTGTTFDEVTPYGFRFYATTHASTVVGKNVGLHWVADASLPALTTSIGG